MNKISANIILDSIIEDVKSEVKKTLKNEVVSIYLIGSASRNELYIDINQFSEEPYFYGDIEFVVFTKKKKKTKTILDKLSQKYQEIHGNSPLFSLDFGIYHIRRIKFLPRILWTFEFQEFGRIIYGEEIRNKMKPVNIENIDLGNLKHLILVRLWNSYKLLPNAYFQSTDLNNQERKIITYVFARNILDYYTVLLPHHGHLIGGYRNRNAFAKRKLSLSSSISNILDASLNIKTQGVSSEEDPHLYHKNFVKVYEDLIIKLFGLGFINSNDKVKGFNESLYKNLRWRYLDNKYLLSRKYPFNKILFWNLNNRIRQHLIQILFLTHCHLIEERQDIKENLLASIISKLKELDIGLFEDDNILESNNSGYLKVLLTSIFNRHFYGMQA